MEIISLLVKSRRGVSLSQTYLIDVDDIATPIVENSVTKLTEFSLREGKQGPSQNQAQVALTDYGVNESLATISSMSAKVFVATVSSVRGRVRKTNVKMGFNADFICGPVKPSGGGSIFMYQEEADPALVEYIVTETPAMILSQISTATLDFEKGIKAHVGGGQGSAYQLTKSRSRVDTCSTNNDSVKMMAAIAGMGDMKVTNAGVKDIALYPLLGDNFIGLAANTPLIIVSGETVVMFAYENGTWTY